MRVNLEFSSDGHRYRIHRSTGHRGAPTVQLERLDEESGEWIGESDRAREATHRVAQILGMDYEGFVRSVLLPQGQFQQFLSGKPEERRKVLDGLLRLDVYERMLRAANEITKEQSSRVEVLQNTLEQYSDTTPEALKQAKAALTELNARSEALKKAQESVSAALRTAEGMSRAIEEARAASDELKKAETDVKEAEATLKDGDAEAARLNAELAAIEDRLAKIEYDPDAHDRAQRALGSVQELEREEKDLAGFESQIEEAAAAAKARATDFETASKAVEAAKDTAAKAKERYEELRRHNAAIVVRQGLKPGDPCPVCGQKVGELPVEKHASLDEARLASANADEKVASAEKAMQDAQRMADRAAHAVESLEKQQAKLSADVERRRTAVTELLGGRLLTAAEVAAHVKEHAALRDQRAKLESEGREVRKRHDETVASLAEANALLAAARSLAEAAARRIEGADAAMAEGRSALEEAAAANDWPDVDEALASGRDAEPVLRKRDSQIDDETASVHRDIGSTEANIKRIEEGIAKAKDIRKDMDEAKEAATLAKDLASLLGVRAFPNYIRERALKVLAQDGSAQLLRISDNRYEFRVEGQEFMVADGWNLGEARSVKTLSGGETFLASLALALALAERLPTLGAGTHASALESLLIDEGFSNLDVETLDEVAKALEIIAEDRTRMVGIVTHLEELAERMPARIRVHKDRSHSTVTIE
jgi:exonuclease SbcC